MKKKLPIIAIILIFIIGLGIMSYPLVSSMINNSKFKDGMNDYTETVKKLDKKDYTKLFKSANLDKIKRNYGEKLFVSRPKSKKPRKRRVKTRNKK